MSIDLVEDVFKPVFRRLEAEKDYLSACTPGKRWRNAGLENNWFQPKIVTAALKKRGRARGWDIDEYVSGYLPEQKGKVDLRLRDADCEVLLELKAANDFRVNYVLGIEADGWFTKYGHRPLLAGCLFLGCASDQRDANARLKKVAESAWDYDLALMRHGTIATDEGHYWVLGLIATRYGRALSAKQDGQPVSEVRGALLQAARLTKPQEKDARKNSERSRSRTIRDRIRLLPSSLEDCLKAVTDYLHGLGGEMHERADRLAFKKGSRNFAHVEVRSKDKVLIFVRLNRSLVREEPGFIRSSGFEPAYPEGEIEITIRERSDVERAKALLQRAYAET